MSLPYGYTVSSAEYEGLLAGLQAAYDAGVRSLAIQVSQTCSAWLGCGRLVLLCFGGGGYKLILSPLTGTLDTI
jgi:hypothetical protein